MFYQDYQMLANLKQKEIERKAKHAWKFFEQPETKKLQWREKAPAKCCTIPANA